MQSVRRDIRFLVERKLLRLGRKFSRDCRGQIDSECIQKCIQMGARAPQAMQLQGL